MKTALVTTCWLGNQEYVERMNKWLDYYMTEISDDLKYDDIIILDNASPFSEIKKLLDPFPPIMLQRFHVHYDRPAHYDYMYLWRAVDFYQEIFKEYDKIIYMDNDFYVLSKNMVDAINRSKLDLWWSPWCKRHNFAETGLQVIGKENKEYQLCHPWSQYNGQCMEHVLENHGVLTDTVLKGDRHSEYGITEQDPTWDFSAQVPANMKMEYKR